MFVQERRLKECLTVEKACFESWATDTFLYPDILTIGYYSDTTLFEYPDIQRTAKCLHIMYVVNFSFGNWRFRNWLSGKWFFSTRNTIKAIKLYIHITYSYVISTLCYLGRAPTIQHLSVLVTYRRKIAMIWNIDSSIAFPSIWLMNHNRTFQYYKKHQNIASTAAWNQWYL